MWGGFFDRCVSQPRGGAVCESLAVSVSVAGGWEAQCGVATFHVALGRPRGHWDFVSSSVQWAHRAFLPHEGRHGGGMRLQWVCRAPVSRFHFGNFINAPKGSPLLFLL